MEKSYASKFLKIYFWQTGGIILGFLTMFIVIPKLTAFPAIYGIYSLCIFTTIFLSYADFGFLTAGYKYASESFARKNLDEEIKIVGFVSYILFIFAILFSFFIFICATDPRILIKNLRIQEEIKIASNLLFILALFSPVIVFQRFLHIVYGIRLENYICQKIFIFFNLIAFASVFYFFRDGRYNIAGYFLFSQIMTLLASFILVLMAKKKYGYDFNLLLKSFKFSKEIYYKTRNLAFATVYITIVWIIYYEIDPFVIAKLFGLEKVAFYAVGLTLSSFFRGTHGTLYAPFLARFSHFVGLGDDNGLRDFYQSIIILITPLIIFPTISILLLAKSLVYCWVGTNYSSSILISQLLLAIFLFGFITYPAGLLIIAKEKIKLLIIISSILPIVYWIGIYFSVSLWQLNAFAFFKFFAFFISALIYINFTIRFLKINFSTFFKKTISPVIFSSLLIVVILLYLKQFMPVEKSKLNLLIVIGTAGAASFLGLCLYYLFSAYFRRYINKFIVQVIA